MSFASITIVLDASFDLYAAGENNDAAAIESFQNAYEACAAHIAQESGVEIVVIFGSSDSDVGPSEDDFGGSIWQDIHDCMYLDGDGDWGFSEKKAAHAARKLIRARR